MKNNILDMENLDSVKQKQRKIGEITSNAKYQEGTLTVSVTSYKKHYLYKKSFKVKKKYIVDHPSKEKLEIGQQVEIISCRPVSKTKSFEILRIIGDKNVG